MIVGELKRINNKKLIMVSAMQGSGKTANMVEVSRTFLTSSGKPPFTVVIAPNESLVDQIGVTYQERGFTLIDSKCKRDSKSGLAIRKEFQAIEARGGRGALMLSGIGHHGGDFTKITKVLFEIMELSHDIGRQVLIHIDEFDQMLTQLTGGINSTYAHSPTIMERLARIHKSEAISLNIFDKCREYNVIVMGWSGTMNHDVASKMSSAGYNPADICLIAVHPIEDLCPSTPMIGLAGCDFVMKMREEEQRRLQDPGLRDRKMMLFQPNTTEIDKWKSAYTEYNGRSPAYIEISHRTQGTYTAEDYARVDYIVGINKVSRGFNAQTYTGEHLSAVFINRLASDRSSQPLSANASHILHVEESSLLKQMAGRARDKHCNVYVPLQFDGVTMYDMHRRVFNVTCAAVTEVARYGPPGTTQYERECHGILVAICQNIAYRDELTPTISKLLAQLFELTGRQLEDEYEMTACDFLFWRGMIGELWRYYLETAGIADEEERIAEVSSRIAVSRVRRSVSSSHASRVSPPEDTPSSTPPSGILQGGGGERKTREIASAVKEAVIARACGRCAICSDVEDDLMDIAHIRPVKDGGSATVDNLVYAHAACQHMMDTFVAIPDPTLGGVWCRSRFSAKLHTAQFSGVSKTNKLRYWALARMHIGIAHGAAMHKWLQENGYKYIA